MSFQLGPRRATYIDISQVMKEKGGVVSVEDVRHFETFDLIYRVPLRPSF